MVFSSLAIAAPVPAPLAVPVPGLPLAATVPDSPPTIPVSVPFLVTTSVPVLGGMTGPEDDDVLAGAVGTGVADGVVVTGRRSLQPADAITKSVAANIGAPT